MPGVRAAVGESVRRLCVRGAARGSHRITGLAPRVPRNKVADYHGDCAAFGVAARSVPERLPQSGLEPDGMARVAFRGHMAYSVRRDTLKPTRGLRWSATRSRLGVMTPATFSTLDFPAELLPAGPLTETTVGWGEDTVCAVCWCALPASAPAWEDRDCTLCADCAAVEMER